MSHDDYYEDDRPPRIGLLRIALAFFAAAAGLVLYCTIFRVG